MYLDPTWNFVVRNFVPVPPLEREDWTVWEKILYTDKTLGIDCRYW